MRLAGQAWAGLSVQDLIESLVERAEHPDLDLLAEIIRRSAEVLEALSYVVRDERLQYSDAPGRGWAPVQAARLLGAIGRPEAVGPLAKMLDSYLYEETAMALAKLGTAGARALMEYAADSNHTLHGRSAALHALCAQAADSATARDRTVRFLRELLAAPSEDPRFIGHIVSRLCDLRAVEAYPEIKRAFQKGRVPRQILQLKDVADRLGISAGSEREALALGRHVGRNDPCPCGSGKKYKHCHGRRPH